MNETADIWVVYDGECPFCSAYVRMVRLKNAAGRVRLLDARTPHPVVDELRAKGFDLDEGMALKIGDAIYHGDDCVHQLALMSGPVGVLNRLHFWIFSNPKRTAALYPLMRAGRNLALKLLGRRKLRDPHAPATAEDRGAG